MIFLVTYVTLICGSHYILTGQYFIWNQEIQRSRDLSKRINHLNTDAKNFEVPQGSCLSTLILGDLILSNDFNGIYGLMTPSFYL